MQLPHGLHLAYCTNVHPGEDWPATLRSLEQWTLAVKHRVCPAAPYGIGLRLSDQAARELSDPPALLAFQRWLDRHGCYVFTINGFPFGRFHGTRVKEQVYRPDWADPRRLEYTNRLGDLLARLVPAGVAGSVSTLPGSFKEFPSTPAQAQAIRDNLWRCVEQLARLRDQTGRHVHLGLEPEPFGLFENSAETAAFFDCLRAEHPGDARLEEHLGVTYDTCHFAIEFEEPQDAIARLRRHGIRLSKIHLSNALRLRPTPAALARLASFAEEVYLHQVIVRAADGSLTRFKDLDLALQSPVALRNPQTDEWRVHFHVPLHHAPTAELGNTAAHVEGLLGLLGPDPRLCAHLEMETYTWAVLPPPFQSRDVTAQLVGEYAWTLQRLARHGLAAPPGAAG
jgi:sugar phosphate isomerase/epimerase